jgi:hypothetical protein
MQYARYATGRGLLLPAVVAKKFPIAIVNSLMRRFLREHARQALVDRR